MSLPAQPPGQIFRLPPPPLLPAQTRLGPPLACQVFPHHTVLDPVAFQASRIPRSGHCYTTGTLLDVDTLPADRPSKCKPSQLSHTMPETHTEPFLGLQSSVMTSPTTGTGGRNLTDLPVANLPLGGSLLQDKNLQPQSRQALHRPLLQVTQAEESTKLESNP